MYELEEEKERLKGLWKGSSRERTIRGREMMATMKELKERNLISMSKVLLIGTLSASLAYIVVGSFGWATFSMSPDKDIEMGK